MTGLRMAGEMREQPGVLAALAERRGEIAARARAARPEPLHGTVLGRHLLEPAPRGLSKVTPTA